MHDNPESSLYVGLMSGTSTDAVDAALVDFSHAGARVIATYQHPFDMELRERLLQTAQGDMNSDRLETVAILDHQLGLVFANATVSLLNLAGIGPDLVRAIGSHGYTVRHRPGLATPFTMQIGDANLIAEVTGITTIADMRRRDMAAGGQGAPLAPAFHQALFTSSTEDRAVANIGGIANLTTLPTSPDTQVIGYDTGPGNTLMDGWASRHLDKPFDADGRWASQGCINRTLLSRMLEDGYFLRLPPKSTGRELFNLAWLDRIIESLNTAFAPADVQATLCEFTATSLARAVNDSLPNCRHLAVCGGGARNSFLMQRLQHQLENCEIATTAAWGIDPQWVEAVGFAWLAYQTISGRPGNLPSVTGASHPVILGGIYPGRRGI